MIVYADTLFAVNFAMDFLSLILTSRILRRAPHPARFLIAAALGGAYGLLSLLLEPYPLIALPCHLLAAYAICRIAFGKRTFLPLALFSAASFLLGGIMTWAFSLLSRLLPAPPTSPDQSAAPSPLGILFLATAAMLALFSLLQSARNHRSAGACTLTVTIASCTVRLPALIDTAHFLTEPLSGLPVLLLPPTCADRLLDPSLKSILLAPDPTAALPLLPSAQARRIRILPLATATSSRLIAAIRPDEASVDGRKVDAYIAFAQVKEALLPPSLSP